MAHSFIELVKPLHYNKALIYEEDYKANDVEYLLDAYLWFLCIFFALMCVHIFNQFLYWVKWFLSESHSVVSDSLQPPWNSPGQNTGVGSLSLLQGIFPTEGLNPGPLHCTQILYQLSHKGSPYIGLLAFYYWAIWVLCLDTSSLSDIIIYKYFSSLLVYFYLLDGVFCPTKVFHVSEIQFIFFLFIVSCAFDVIFF